MAHTILLIQAGERADTKTYADFNTVDSCMEGICKIYEEHLKKSNRRSKTITYDIKELFEFIDRITDITCLVYDEGTTAYVPYTKDMIKEKIYIYLRKQVI